MCLLPYRNTLPGCVTCTEFKCIHMVTVTYHGCICDIWLSIDPEYISTRSPVIVLLCVSTRLAGPSIPIKVRNSDICFSLTHWGRDRMATVSQPSFSNAFLLMKICQHWLWFHLRLFLRAPLPIFQDCFRWWAPSHYLSQWWLDYRRIYASPG